MSQITHYRIINRKTGGKSELIPVVNDETLIEAIQTQSTNGHGVEVASIEWSGVKGFSWNAKDGYVIETDNIGASKSEMFADILNMYEAANQAEPDYDIIKAIGEKYGL